MSSEGLNPERNLKAPLYDPFFPFYCMPAQKPGSAQFREQCECDHLCSPTPIYWCIQWVGERVCLAWRVTRGSISMVISNQHICNDAIKSGKLSPEKRSESRQCFEIAIATTSILLTPLVHISLVTLLTFLHLHYTTSASVGSSIFLPLLFFHASVRLLEHNVVRVLKFLDPKPQKCIVSLRPHVGSVKL